MIKFLRYLIILIVFNACIAKHENKQSQINLSFIAGRVIMSDTNIIDDMNGIILKVKVTNSSNDTCLILLNNNKSNINEYAFTLKLRDNQIKLWAEQQKIVINPNDGITIDIYATTYKIVENINDFKELLEDGVLTYNPYLVNKNVIHDLDSIRISKSPNFKYDIVSSSDSLIYTTKDWFNSQNL